MRTRVQHKEAEEFIKAGFRCFTEARRHLTIWEFREATARLLTELGGRGYVASVGAAIVEASNADGQSAGD